MRARQPDRDGYVERAGVKVFYEVFGERRPTILFLPSWSVVHSLTWKMQVPYLARHYRVVTFDGRGNGRSGRPAGAGSCLSAGEPADARAAPAAAGTARPWSAPKQSEDGGSWGLETAPGTLADTRRGAIRDARGDISPLLAGVRCPCLIIQGTEDAIVGPGAGRKLAAALGARARLVELAGSGHSPHARDPVKVNLLIREFIEAAGHHPEAPGPGREAPGPDAARARPVSRRR